MKMVGVDVGGTFTDAVYYDDQSGELAWAKAPSTPQAPAGGVLAAMDRNGVDLRTTDRFVHGVTIGTNAILERRGAPVWVITTKGFRDTLEIARTNRTVLYDIKTLKPASLVPRQRVIEVDERVLADGSVARPLDPGEVHKIAAQLRTEPPGALAVCFLHSYINADHEEAAVKILRAALPAWFVCHSAEILPEMREYERFNTAVINAYIGPLTARYLGELSRMMRERGYRGAVHLMASSGGIETAERAARFPVHTVLSGPAGGVAAAIHLGGLVGARNLITYDMGGTSTDVCLIEDLNVPLTSEQFIDGLPVRIPQIEINSVGAGGGSIAWVDTGKILKVGPRSAGAVPGPACYGKGGTEPTVTDANLAIGRLAPSIKLAGTVALDQTLANQAVRRIVEVFDSLDVPRAAEGIIRIAVARMVSAIKEISVSKGYDPRDFALVAFGGAGPMHAAFIAEELEIGHVLIPLRPGNFCAFGALISDIRHDHLRTHRAAVVDAALKGVDAAFEQIEVTAQCAMLEEGLAASDVSLQRSAGMRYVGQSWDLIVRLPARMPDTAALASLFHAAHERRYGYCAADPIEIVSLRVTATGRVAKPKLGEWTVVGTLDAAQEGLRQVWFAGKQCEAPVYARDWLPRDARIEGPAIIEEMGAVTIVPPTWRVEVGQVGELHLKRGVH
jgi:N-methylhydantoinase A